MIDNFLVKSKGIRRGADDDSLLIGIKQKNFVMIGNS